MKHFAPSLLAVAGLACAAALAGGCKKPAAEKEAPVTRVHVDTATVAEEAVPRTIALDGTLRGERETDLAANASGRVIETLVDRGSRVKKGDVLAKLDTKAASDMAAEASANVALVNAQAESAQRECDRMKQLLDAKAISQAEFDRTADQCKTVPISKQAAQARQAAAAQAVLDGTVRAPFDGVIGQRDVEVGEYVRPDSRVATLLDVDPLRLEMTVPESAAPTIQKDAEVTFTVAGYADRTFKGKIRFVSPAVREATRDVVVDAEVENPDGALMPGMFADVRVASGTTKQPVFPASAIVDRGERQVVFVVVDRRLEERVVQLGPKLGDRVAAIRGLKAGDVVVDHPDAKLFNGEAVE